ncbi:RyR domain-containing protein [Mycobacterium sp. LTG2003]
MPVKVSPLRTALMVSSALVVVLVAALAVRAHSPSVATKVPGWPDWFGRPGSAISVLFVTAAMVIVCVLFLRAQQVRRTGAPVAIVAGLAVVSVVLGMASYWRCHDERENPFFFTALMWTASLIKGNIGDPSVGGARCPDPAPVALDVARLTALGVLFITVLGVVAALFRDRLDRLRIVLARSVTVVVGIDDDASSMVRALTSDKRGFGTVVIVTENPDRPCVQEPRSKGARVVTVAFDLPESWTSMSMWRKVNRLYLLSPDASMNLMRLELIKRRVDLAGPSGDRRGRHVPLIVRIDDPWQAEAWRAQQMGTDDSWAPDAVGKYEVTAGRLLDRIIEKDKVSRVVVCGTSQLTLALCADMAQRRLEYDYYPGEAVPPALTLVGENAEEYKHDHDYHRKQLGLQPESLVVEAISQAPTVPVLKSILTDHRGAVHTTTAVILVDSDPIGGSSIDSSTGTRLAAQLPTVPIYAWDPKSHDWGAGGHSTADQTGDDEPFLVGRLRTFGLSMDLPTGQAQDAWERAARLIHSRYAATVSTPSPATVPWHELDPFYQGSNRRLVLNALWIVRTHGGHTWDTWGSATESATPSGFADMAPMKQLGALGFTEQAAMAMAEKEHTSWCDYYFKAGWRPGEVRDDNRKIHPRLMPWDDTRAKDAVHEATLRSLANTLVALRQLGYRSRPEWQRFDRTGTVTARQRDEPWTWISHTGDTMYAEAGDWEVSDDNGTTWSVNNERFAATYARVGENGEWRRTGNVLARLAVDGEIIETLEGPERAKSGDWVVKGERGEQWPVPPDDFAKNYRGPITTADSHRRPKSPS